MDSNDREPEPTTEESLEIAIGFLARIAHEALKAKTDDGATLGAVESGSAGLTFSVDIKGGRCSLFGFVNSGGGPLPLFKAYITVPKYRPQIGH